MDILRNIYRDKNGNFRDGDLEIFIEIVIDNYLVIIENKKRINQISKTFSESTTEKKSEIFSETMKMEHIDLKLTIQSIVMLCTFFEALINEIGMVGLGQNYYKENLDKLSILSKYEIVLRLVYNKSLNKETQYYENIKLLIKTRNDLAHYKSKIILNPNFEKVYKAYVSKNEYFEKLNKCINSFQSFYSDLKTMDKDHNILSSDFNKQIRRIEKKLIKL